MNEPVKCFFVEPTDQADRYLRRYVGASESGKCAVARIGYHNAEALIGRFPVMLGDEQENGHRYELSPDASEYEDDQRWPTHCECGYQFTPGDKWQVNCERVYTSRQRPGEEFTLKYPRTPGMMWNAWWMPDIWHGPDGLALIVVTPDAWEWTIDGPCNNCTMPNDKDHQCWCRHGEVPFITVDKTPNPGETTCSAGGGSIQTPGYHGFLRNGIFTN